MATKVPQYVQDALKLLKYRTNLECASVGFTEKQLQGMVAKPNRGGPGINDVPEMREQLRLFFQSWVNPIIDALAEPDAPYSRICLKQAAIEARRYGLCG